MTKQAATSKQRATAPKKKAQALVGELHKTATTSLGSGDLGTNPAVAPIGGRQTAASLSSSTMMGASGHKVYVCHCGREFTHGPAFSTHKRTCSRPSQGHSEPDQPSTQAGTSVVTTVAADAPFTATSATASQGQSVPMVASTTGKNGSEPHKAGAPSASTQQVPAPGCTSPGVQMAPSLPQSTTSLTKPMGRCPTHPQHQALASTYKPVHGANKAIPAAANSAASAKATTTPNEAPRPATPPKSVLQRPQPRQDVCTPADTPSGYPYAMAKPAAPAANKDSAHPPGTVATDTINEAAARKAMPTTLNGNAPCPVPRMCTAPTVKWVPAAASGTDSHEPSRAVGHAVGSNAVAVATAPLPPARPQAAKLYTPLAATAPKAPSQTPPREVLL